DPDFFTLGREWSLLNFLLFRQKCSDFRADKHEEHSRYARSLAMDGSQRAIAFWMGLRSAFNHPTSLVAIGDVTTRVVVPDETCSTTQHSWLRSGMPELRLGWMFTHLMGFKERKSNSIDNFWKTATLAQEKKVANEIERSVLLDELATSAVHSTLQRDRQESLVREKVSRRLESIDDDRTYKRHRSQSPNIENDQKKSDTEAINNERNLDEKRVEEELVKRYNLRERQEINYAEISSSDIDPHHHQAFDPLPNNPDSSVISLNRPIITEVTYNLISTHIICAFSSTLHLVRGTVDESLFEKIEKLLRMRNKLILDKSITLKLEAIFQTDYAEISSKIMTETEVEKNMKASEESRFLFFIRHTLLDFIAMYEYMSPKVLARDMSERSYIVERLSPILRSFRNAFPDIRYEWIEKDVKSIRDASNMFAINIRTRKTDVLVLRLSDATEILHVEVSGPPYKPEKKHTVGDAKKLLMMAVCNLCRMLANNFDCSIEIAKKVRSYCIQAIGDKLTLFAVSLVDKKKYLAIELASNEFIEQEKILEKICSFVPSVDDTSDLREWVHLPDDDLIPVKEEEMDELFLNDTQ
ncbi:8844_t:CDS:2, partial [Ambispora leptoticha]